MRRKLLNNLFRRTALRTVRRNAALTSFSALSLGAKRASEQGASPTGLRQSDA